MSSNKTRTVKELCNKDHKNYSFRAYSTFYIGFSLNHVPTNLSNDVNFIVFLVLLYFHQNH